MIPSYFKIEILAIQDEFVLSGRKGLMCFGGDTVVQLTEESLNDMVSIIQLKFIVTLLMFIFFSLAFNVPCSSNSLFRQSFLLTYEINLFVGN